VPPADGWSPDGNQGEAERLWPWRGTPHRRPAGQAGGKITRACGSSSVGDDVFVNRGASRKQIPISFTARFGPDGITLCDPNRAGEGADKVFQRIYEKPI